MQRPSINTSCAKVVKELRLTGKEIFSVADLKTALIAVGRGSITSQRDYIGRRGEYGYLESRGFIERVPGGWALTTSSMRVQTIEVWIHVANGPLVGEVSTAIGEALEGFKGTTHTIMEV